MNVAEMRRLQEYYKPGSQTRPGDFPGDLFVGASSPAYPGGSFFNFAGFGKTEVEMKSLKAKEVENGRLAMLAMLGYFTQAAFTHESPIANLSAHLADPVANNILTTFANVGGAL